MNNRDTILGQFEKNYDGTDESIEKAFTTTFDWGFCCLTHIRLDTDAQLILDDVETRCLFIRNHRNDILETLNNPEVLW